MAQPNSKKRLVQIPAPSASSSSSEEQQDSSGSGSSSSSEEGQQPPQPVTLKPHQQQQDEDDSAEDDDEETEESDEPEKLALENPSLKKPQSQSESKEDEESDSDDEESDSDDEESDSDDEAIKSPMVSDFTLKPRVPNSAKRAATENSGSSSKNKKAKVSNGGDGQIVRSPDVAKKSTSSRVWSGDDEIKLLEGIIAYKAKNGSDSITNLGPFHETVKDLNLSLDVTRTRLYEKLRALKKKYLNNVAKKGDIVFSKPHELKLYKLSEMLWGGGEGGLNEESGSKVKSPDKNKSNKAANVSVKKPVENKDMVKKSVENKDMVKTDQVSDEIKDDALDVGSLYPRLAASIELEASTYLPGMSINSKDFTKEMVLKLGKEKAIELEEEWNDYTEMEHRLFAERLQMIHKHAETFLDVMKH